MVNQEKGMEENLTGIQALAKIRAIVDDAKTCFFCTKIRTGIPMSVRPMTVLEVDDAGYLWFFTGRSTHKDDEIEQDPFVHLMLQSGQRAGFLNIYGLAKEVKDIHKVKSLWNPTLENWFDGPNDPELVLLSVEVLEGHYWDNKHSAPIAAFKYLKSLLTGNPEDMDGVHGDLSV